METTIVIFFLSLLGGWLFDLWWIVAVIAFGAAGLSRFRHGGLAFAAGFVGVGLGWFLVPAWTYFATGGILSTKVATLMKLSSPILLVLVTGLIGGLVGGFSALSGHYLRVALLGEEKVSEEKMKVRKITIVVRRILFWKKRNLAGETEKEG